MNNEPSETRKRIVAGSTLSAGVILAIALFAMVNFVAMRHYKRFDWTSADLYSLSEKSVNVVAGIDRDIDAIVFLSPGTPLFDQVDELLSRYEAANPRIKKRVIDAVRNRLEAERLVERFGIERANVVVLASGDDRRVIDEMDLVEYDYATAQYGQPPTVKGFKGEQMITSAILELVEDQKPKVLFTTGHGEASIDGIAGGMGAPGGARTLNDAVSLLGQDNFDLDSWSSLGQSEVPAETDLVVVAGPTSRFLAPELTVFTDYLDAGGRMLIMLDPAFDESGAYDDVGLAEWLVDYGVALERDIVIDPDQRLPMFGAETLFTMAYGFHPIVESLADRPVMLPLARSVSRAETVPDVWEVTELVTSSAEAWGETNLNDLENVAPDGDDLTGPISLAVAVTRTDPETLSIDPDQPDANPDSAGIQGQKAPSRLVVFGDFDFASDEWVRNGANAGLLLNTLNWLIEREQLLAIEPRTPEQTKLLLGPGELGFIYLLVMALLPGLAIIAGVLVYLRRRR